MVDRDFEKHLQELFDAPAPLDDTEQFALLIDQDIQRMRRTTLWLTGLAAAGAAAGAVAGVYLAFDPLWNRLSGAAMVWASQATAATPYSSMLVTSAGILLAVIAATIGLINGRKA